MHNYKKGLLCIMVLSAMSLMAAEDKPLRSRRLQTKMVKTVMHVHCVKQSLLRKKI